ncbi:tripartite motif-containing protein 16-like [Cheilinus undulatus]|uniref:tripartite motif-containing protein 16-like n=1 Tax=Cheilinus undulatus TaxID=241271 RepID=UPI001BD274DC|nr:tripartite motif-containing protein 16-like [Cheilinus undulatus]
MAQREAQQDCQTGSGSVFEKDHMSLPCGHSSCKDCLQSFTAEGKCLCYVCVIQGGFESGKLDTRLRKRSIEALQVAVERINHSADEAEKESKEIFSELMQLMKRRHSDVKQKIRSRQEAEVRRMKALQEKLEQDITELEKLSSTEDAPLSHKICPLSFFEDVTASVSGMRDGVKDILGEHCTNSDQAAIEPLMSTLTLTPEPKTRQEFLQYSCDITLDPNTAQVQLLLSEDNRRATLVREEQVYPDHADRFIRWRQVLSAQSLTGRRYWEVEVRTKRVNVAVSYKDIGRAGPINECALGFYKQSWSMECNTHNGKFIHEGVKTHIPGLPSNRIGVYLDHGAGVLAFYGVSDTMTLLHRVQTRFTQPLHAGLWLAGYNGAYAEFCKLTLRRDIQQQSLNILTVA